MRKINASTIPVEDTDNSTKNNTRSWTGNYWSLALLREVVQESSIPGKYKTTICHTSRKYSSRVKRLTHFLILTSNSIKACRCLAINVTYLHHKEARDNTSVGYTYPPRQYDVYTQGARTHVTFPKDFTTPIKSCSLVPSETFRT